MNKEISLLILAAGMGSRYGGLKQVDPLGPSGETIMDYSIYDAAKSGFTKVVFVVREFFKEDFEKRIREKYAGIIKLEFVAQEISSVPDGCAYNGARVKPWGTAHAILMARNCINGPFAVINADDFYGRHSFEVLARFLKENEDSEGKYCMVGFKILNTLSESGGVSRGICSADDKMYLTSVEEHHKIMLQDGKLTGLDHNKEITDINRDALVSMNMWGFGHDIFKRIENDFKTFLLENGDRLDSEFYIPTVVNGMLLDGSASVKVLSTDSEWFGVTYKEDREAVVKKIGELVAEGKYPSPLF